MAKKNSGSVASASQALDFNNLLGEEFKCTKAEFLKWAENQFESTRNMIYKEYVYQYNLLEKNSSQKYEDFSTELQNLLLKHNYKNDTRNDNLISPCKNFSVHLGIYSNQPTHQKICSVEDFKNKHEKTYYRNGSMREYSKESVDLTNKFKERFEKFEKAATQIKDSVTLCGINKKVVEAVQNAIKNA